jgi:hypothetical protein
LRYGNGVCSGITRVARPRSGGNSTHSGSMRYPRRSFRCPARRICGTCSRHGSPAKNVASSNGHVDTLPQTLVILGFSSLAALGNIHEGDSHILKFK